MKKTLILILIILATSCSAMKPRFTHKKKGIDPEFAPYIEVYRSLIGPKRYQNRFDKLSMNFAKLPSGILGRCYWLIGGGFEIEIDKKYWNSPWNYIDKQFTVYHELEHCIRYRMHSNKKIKIKTIGDFFEVIGFYTGLIKEKGFLPDGCPASLMHSHSFSNICQSQHYNYYLREVIDYEK